MMVLRRLLSRPDSTEKQDGGALDKHLSNGFSHLVAVDVEPCHCHNNRKRHHGVLLDTGGQVVGGVSRHPHTSEIIVADTGRHRVLVFPDCSSPSGGGRSPRLVVGGRDTLNYPADVAVSGDGQLVVVSDTGNAAVKCFRLDTGRLAATHLSRDLEYPHGVATFHGHTVTDQYRHAIAVTDIVRHSVTVFDGRGSQWTFGQDVLDTPYFLTMATNDAEPKLFVSDSGHCSLQVFTLGGVPLQTFDSRHFKLPDEDSFLSLQGLAWHDGHLFLATSDSIYVVLRHGRLWRVEHLTQDAKTTPGFKSVAVTDDVIVVASRRGVIMLDYDRDELDALKVVSPIWKKDKVFW